VKEVTWVVKTLKNEKDEEIQSPFEGYLKVKVPFQREKMALLEKLSLKIDENGEVEKVKNVAETNEKLSKLLQEHVSEIKLKIIDTGEAVETLDDLSIYEEGNFVLKRVQEMIFRGIQLGKPSKNP